MNQALSIPAPALTQHFRPWRDDELERLKAYVDRPATALALSLDFPDRTVAAARVQLCKLRRQFGVPKHDDPHSNLTPATIAPTILHPKDPGVYCDYDERWRAAAEISNRNFLSALVRIAA